MTDLITINEVTNVVQVTDAPTVVTVTEDNTVVDVVMAGVQGPPGPQGTPGIGLVNYIFDGNGSPLAAGSKGVFTVPFNCVISAWTMLGNTTGSVQLDVQKATYAAFPTASSISPTNKPQIVSDIKAASSTLTGWSPAVSAGEILVVNIDSASGIGRLTLGLSLTRV